MKAIIQAVSPRGYTARIEIIGPDQVGELLALLSQTEEALVWAGYRPTSSTGQGATVPSAPAAAVSGQQVPAAVKPAGAGDPHPAPVEQPASVEAGVSTTDGAPATSAAHGSNGHKTADKSKGKGRLSDDPMTCFWACVRDLEEHGQFTGEEARELLKKHNNNATQAIGELPGI